MCVCVLARTRVLAEAAKRLEHGIHSMCATPSGYMVRVGQKRRAIAALGVGMDTGTGVRDGERDDDGKEIMAALHGSVEGWHKGRIQ